MSKENDRAKGSFQTSFVLISFFLNIGERRQNLCQRLAIQQSRQSQDVST